MQMLASGNELTANGNRESTRIRTINRREWTRNDSEENKTEPQMHADRIGFGYGSCKIEARKSLVTFMCFSVKPIGRSRRTRPAVGKSS